MNLKALCPELYRSIYRQGSLLANKKNLLIGVAGEKTTGCLSLCLMGTRFKKVYASFPFAPGGIGTYLAITQGIQFKGDLTMITPLDIMEHCSLQNVRLIGLWPEGLRQFSLSLH